MKKFLYPMVLALVSLLLSCDPYIEEGVEVAPQPAPPEFTLTFVEGDSNRVVFTDNTPGVFSRLWTFGENEFGDKPSPTTSDVATDTVTFIKPGTYPVTLYASVQGGGSSEHTVTMEITTELQLECDETLGALTGDCEEDGKIWVFSTEEGAIKVGPEYGNFEWYSSPADGLVPEQYDDRYQFIFENSAFIYDNNGLTVNPWDGYEAQPLDRPATNFIFSEGTGTDGQDQIILPEGYFMGVRDSDNVLDIYELTEDRLVVRAPVVDADGNVVPGWFECIFVPAQ